MALMTALMLLVMHAAGSSKKRVALCIVGELRDHVPKVATGVRQIMLESEWSNGFEVEVLVDTAMTARSDKSGQSQASERVSLNELTKVYGMKLASLHVERDTPSYWRANEYVPPTEVIELAPVHSQGTLKDLRRMQRCNEVRSQLERSRGTRFVAVVKMCPDSKFCKSGLPSKQFFAAITAVANGSAVFYQDRFVVHGRMVSDKYAVGTSEAMDVYMTAFDKAHTLWEEIKEAGGFESHVDDIASEQLMNYYMRRIANFDLERYFVPCEGDSSLDTEHMPSAEVELDAIVNTVGSERMPGVVLQIVAPKQGAVEVGSVRVDLNLQIGVGDGANFLRRYSSRWKVCYAIATMRRCQPLLRGGGTEPLRPTGATPRREWIVAWLQFGSSTHVALARMPFNSVSTHFWMVPSDNSAAINVDAARLVPGGVLSLDLRVALTDLGRIASEIRSREGWRLCAGALGTTTCVMIAYTRADQEHGLDNTSPSDARAARFIHWRDIRCRISLALDIDIAGPTLWVSTWLQRNETILELSHHDERLDYAAFDSRFVEPILHIDGGTLTSSQNSCDESTALQEAVVVSVRGPSKTGTTLLTWIATFMAKATNGSAGVLTSQMTDDNGRLVIVHANAKHQIPGLGGDVSCAHHPSGLFSKHYWSPPCNVSKLEAVGLTSALAACLNRCRQAVPTLPQSPLRRYVVARRDPRDAAVSACYFMSLPQDQFDVVGLRACLQNAYVPLALWTKFWDLALDDARLWPGQVVVVVNYADLLERTKTVYHYIASTALGRTLTEHQVDLIVNETKPANLARFVGNLRSGARLIRDAGRRNYTAYRLDSDFLRWMDAFYDALQFRPFHSV